MFPQLVNIRARIPIQAADPHAGSFPWEALLLLAVGGSAGVMAERTAVAGLSSQDTARVTGIQMRLGFPLSCASSESQCSELVHPGVE